MCIRVALNQTKNGFSSSTLRSMKFPAVSWTEHQATAGFRLLRLEQRLQRLVGCGLQARGFHQRLDRLANRRVFAHDDHNRFCHWRPVILSIPAPSIHPH
jgi:hypothetical protein